MVALESEEGADEFVCGFGFCCALLMVFCFGRSRGATRSLQLELGVVLVFCFVFVDCVKQRGKGSFVLSRFFLVAAISFMHCVEEHATARRRRRSKPSRFFLWVFVSCCSSHGFFHVVPMCLNEL